MVFCSNSRKKIILCKRPDFFLCLLKYGTLQTVAPTITEKDRAIKFQINRYYLDRTEIRISYKILRKKYDSFPTFYCTIKQKNKIELT